MNRNMVKIRQLSLRIILLLLAISVYSIVSFAASVSITQSNIQAVNGVYYNVTSGFTSDSSGSQVVQASGPASTLPCTWSNGGTCQTAARAGDWQYSVTLMINSGAATSHAYTLSVRLDTGNGYSTLGALTVTTPSSIPAGQTMTFLIDTGGQSFTAPAGIVITVA
jgi:hypothetical protein